MKMYNGICLLLILCSQLFLSQKKSPPAPTEIDRKMLQIPETETKSSTQIAKYIVSNFNAENDRVKAAFFWVINNIRYDVEKMYVPSFYENRSELVDEALKTRKGVCENYASLFSDICQKMNIQSYVVPGYTKENGKVNSQFSHAWSAVLVEGSWYMFDPTWAAGYISNGKFYKKINYSLFKVKPSDLIKTHMPFDYLWQFLAHPITNEDFYSGKFQDNSVPFFDFENEVKAYASSDFATQLAASADRIKKNGITNKLIANYLKNVEDNLANERRNSKISSYNAAVLDYNDAVGRYNEYVSYKNQQFTPAKSDAEIKRMLYSAEEKLRSAQEKLQSAAGQEDNSENLSGLKKKIDEDLASVQTEKAWLDKYFSKSKIGRKSMFYKVSWFGIPARN